MLRNACKNNLSKNNELTKIVLNNDKLIIDLKHKLIETKKNCNFFCNESFQPLCDNTGHTHKNRCK